MKSLFRISLLVSFSLLTSFSTRLSAQQMRIVTSGEGFFIPETGTMILSRDGVLTVDMPHLPGKTGIDIQKGDQVAMAQRKKVSTLDELRALYKETPHGEAFKLGLRREGKLVIASITRDTSSAGGGGRTMVFDSRTGGGSAGTGGMRQFVVGGDPNGIHIWQEAGVVFRLDGTVIKIAALVEQMNPAGKNAGLQADDVVVSVNGTAAASMDAVRKALASKTGSHELELKRGSATLKIRLL